MSRPIFNVTIGGANISAAVSQRLLSLTVRDLAGDESDTFILRLDDTIPRIPTPAPGDLVTVQMGYAETGLVDMGEFYVNEIELSGDPAWEMRVQGESGNMLSAMRTTRSDAWHEMTIAEIVSTIAGRNGWTPVIDPELGGIFIAHIDQRNTSDMHFLTLLAVEHRGVFKLTRGIAVFAKRGAATSITGLPIANLVITPEDDVLNWRALFHRRGHHQELVGRWHDYDAAETVEQRVPGPGDEPNRTLSRRYPDETEATQAAMSESRRLGAVAGRLTLELIGRPTLFAEGFITMTGFREPIDGDWKIRMVEHQLDNSGYRTTVECELPE